MASEYSNGARVAQDPLTVEEALQAAYGEPVIVSSSSDVDLKGAITSSMAHAVKHGHDTVDENDDDEDARSLTTINTAASACTMSSGSTHDNNQRAVSIRDGHDKEHARHSTPPATGPKKALKLTIDLLNLEDGEAEPGEQSAGSNLTGNRGRDREPHSRNREHLAKLRERASFHVEEMRRAAAAAGTPVRSHSVDATRIHLELASSRSAQAVEEFRACNRQLSQSGPSSRPDSAGSAAIRRKGLFQSSCTRRRSVSMSSTRSARSATGPASGGAASCSSTRAHKTHNSASISNSRRAGTRPKRATHFTFEESTTSTGGGRTASATSVPVRSAGQVRPSSGGRTALRKAREQSPSSTTSANRTPGRTPVNTPHDGSPASSASSFATQQQQRRRKPARKISAGNSRLMPRGMTREEQLKKDMATWNDKSIPKLSSRRGDTPTQDRAAKASTKSKDVKPRATTSAPRTNKPLSTPPKPSKPFQTQTKPAGRSAETAAKEPVLNKKKEAASTSTVFVSNKRPFTRKAKMRPFTRKVPARPGKVTVSTDSDVSDGSPASDKHRPRRFGRAALSFFAMRGSRILPMRHMSCDAVSPLAAAAQEDETLVSTPLRSLFPGKKLSKYRSAKCHPMAINKWQSCSPGFGRDRNVSEQFGDLVETEFEDAFAFGKN